MSRVATATYLLWADVDDLQVIATLNTLYVELRYTNISKEYELIINCVGNSTFSSGFCERVANPLQHLPAPKTVFPHSCFERAACPITSHGGTRICLIEA